MRSDHMPEGRGGLLERLFRLKEAGTTVPRECMAGLTTFGAMSYVLIVNPMILATAGLDRHGLVIVTALIAIIGTLIMALWVRLPLAMAPGMSSNVMLAQVVMLQMGQTYRIGFTMIFISGFLFFALSLSGWREKIIMALPASIQLGIQCGLGILIAYIGLHNGGIVTVQGGRIGFADLSHPAVILTYGGLLLTSVLVVMRVPAALLVSIMALTVGGIFVHLPDGALMTRLPARLWDWPGYPWQYFMAFDFDGYASNFVAVLPLTLYFFLTDFFSATATLMAVAGRPPLRTPDGQIPHACRAFIGDAITAMLSAVLGTSTAGVYLESSAGIESGGRTGLTGVVIAFLFFICLFLWPLFTIIPAQATAPALVMVGLMMLRGIAELDASCPENWLPPLLITVIIATTTNLMIALASGCLVYTLVVAAQRLWRRLSPILLGLDATLLLYLILQTHIHK